jgi:hypothetical protein
MTFPSIVFGSGIHCSATNGVNHITRSSSVPPATATPILDREINQQAHLRRQELARGIGRKDVEFDRAISGQDLPAMFPQPSRYRRLMRVIMHTCAIPFASSKVILWPSLNSTHP